MQPYMDWLQLWADLVKARAHRYQDQRPDSKIDYWKDNARNFSAEAEARWSKPDSTRRALGALLAGKEESTLLDIGAGTGNWETFFAPLLKHITALEPSAGMREVLRETIARYQMGAKVRVLEGYWPETDAGVFDFVFSSHSCYGVADFAAFVAKMVQSARETCFILVRQPQKGDTFSLISQMVWGQPNDSPNFTVAYNALLQLGIRANVLLEDESLFQPARYASLDEAYQVIRHRFNLNSADYDQDILSLLKETCVQPGGSVILQQKTRSALIFWNVNGNSL